MPNPAYHSLGDHTEAFQVEYDPGRIGYRDLLDLFWSDHDPYRPQWSVQYRTAVFFHSEEQKELALRSRDLLAAGGRKDVTTAIEPAGAFYPAEDYHQKYHLRRKGELLREYLSLYPDPEDFLRSTAVARVNGFLGGNGSSEDLEAVTGALGLSAEGEERLREYVESTSPRRACPVSARKQPR